MNWTALGVSLSASVVAVGFVVFLADLRNGMKTLTDVVREVRDDLKASRADLNEHNDRLIMLEGATWGNGDRRHILRRTQDQHLRDVRKMANGEDL